MDTFLQSALLRAIGIEAYSYSSDVVEVTLQKAESTPRQTPIRPSEHRVERKDARDWFHFRDKGPPSGR